MSTYLLPLYSCDELTMLPSASDSDERSRHTEDDHTPSRFKNKGDIIQTQEGLGDRVPPIGAKRGI